MASMLNTTILCALVATLASSASMTITGARLLADGPPAATLSLAARLKIEDGSRNGGESANCWESLLELQACSNEIVMFFLNGETYLGPACCHAIRVIEHDCWPNITGSLGFTTQESDILQGYCDEIDDELHSPPSPKLSIAFVN